MSHESPFIDLADFDRRTDLERSAEYSALIIGISLASLAALVGVAIVLARDEKPRDVPLLIVLSLASVLSVAGALWAHRFRVRRSACPTCGMRFTAHLAEVNREDYLYSLVIEHEGRHFCRPLSTDDRDPRTWVRLVREVAACVDCRIYVVTLNWFETPCSDEELAALVERLET